MSLIYYVKYIQEFKQVITKHKMVKLGKDVKCDVFGKWEMWITLSFKIFVFKLLGK